MYKSERALSIVIVQSHLIVDTLRFSFFVLFPFPVFISLFNFGFLSFRDIDL